MLERFKAAAIQMRFAWASVPAELESRAKSLIETAIGQGVELVALPEHCGLALLGILARIHPELCLDEVVGAAGYTSLANCLLSSAPALKSVYEQVFSQLSAQFRVYLAAGTVILPDKGGALYNTAYLFGPEGQIIGTQRQTHLSQMERQWGLSRGDHLMVFETEVGKIGLVVGTDVYYPEVSRILCLRGANVLIHPTCTTAYSQADWMRRLWREVQANQVFGLESALVGGLLEQSCHGKSAIHAPLGITEGNDGLLAAAETTDSEEVVVARLDFNRLQQAIDEYPIYKVLNYRLYEKYFPKVYGLQGGRKERRV
jgi:predicted amidohydrolase